VTGIGDHRPGDRFDDLLDDATIDALVMGEPVDARLGELAAFSREARALGDGPAPRPSPALSALIAQGGTAAERTTPAEPISGPRRRRTASVAASLAGLGAVAKVALGASVGVAGVAAAGAAGVLPGPADRQVRDVIEATTPIDFREPDDDPSPAQDRPATTPSQGDTGSVPTSETPGHTGDRGEAPEEPGQRRGRQDPAGGQGDPGRPEEPGSQGRDPEQPGNQGSNPEEPDNQGRDPEQPGNQGSNPEEPGNQGSNPDQPGQQEPRAPAATTTTAPTNRGQGTGPPGQGQERRAPGNSDGKRPEQSDQSE
jgi:hypothetical protein